MSQGRCIMLLMACLCAGSVRGAGFQLYTEGSTEALGQAGAVSGRTNLLSLAWYNPSALAGAKQPAVLFGSTFVRVETDFSSPAGNASMADDWRVIPHFYHVQPLSTNWTAMLSINAPYGLITEWPSTWAGAALATYSELRSIYITPSIAYLATDRLSLSAGVNLVDAEAKLRRTGSDLKGDDMGYGYTCSAHFQALDDWALGARYQSSVDLKFNGTINGWLDASADLTLPSTASAGVANTSIKNLSLGLDLVWTEWSVYNQMEVATPLGTTIAPKNWDNVWSIRAGGEYALNERWVLRGGYVWDQSPVPDTTRAPELPCSDRQMVMGGIGWKTNRIVIDAAYSYLWAEQADMGTIYSLPGEFGTVTHLVSLSASYRF